MNRFIEQQILNILLEAEKSKGFGRGRYKKIIDELPAALADKNPKELMSRLGVKKIEAGSDILILENFLKQVIAAEGAKDNVMSEVYEGADPAKDSNKQLGFKVRINASEVSIRDASRFMVHAVHAAEKSTYANWSKTPLIESINSTNEFIMYFSDKPGSWSEGKGDAGKKDDKPAPSKDKSSKK